LKKLLKLAEENDDYTERIKELLESACEAHPQESNLWLALGSIYKRLELDEKALQVFIRAQKQISL
jgi:cytochrome c-type biogenesis protein CcmH/NrfG